MPYECRPPRRTSSRRGFRNNLFWKWWPLEQSVILSGVSIRETKGNACTLILPQNHQGVLSSPIDRFSRKRHLRAPLLRQVFPSRILRIDQSHLLRPYPALQLLLAADGLVNVVKALVIYQPVATILAGEPFHISSLVFQRPTVDAICHANVECASAAAHDINEVLVIFHNNSIRLSS